MRDNGMEVKSKEIIHDHLIGLCLDGQCYAFAIAMHRCLGWPMVGLMQGEVIRHAAVTDPEGNLWDCRGEISKEEFGEPYGMATPYNLKPVTEEELDLHPMLFDSLIESLSRAAQLVWPELPWKSDTLVVRVRAFAEELAALSRKHGLWIYGNFPASLPAIAEGDGEEKGYALEAVIGGYMINRSFQS